MEEVEKKEISIYSDGVQDVLSEPPKSIFRWGNTILFFFLLLLVFFSWFIKYPDIIKGQVLLTTLIPPQKVYANATGKLDAILVENNELVKPGTVLAIIENTANYIDVFILKSIIDTLKTKNKDFYFPIDNMPIMFLGDIESDYTLFENSYVLYTLNKKLQPFSNEALANKFSLSELYRRLENLKSQKEINKSELNLKDKDLERNKSLFEKGIISAQDYEVKQLNYLQTERNFKNMAMSISQIEEDISNAKRTSKGTEISRTKEELILLKNVIQSLNQLKKSIRNWELLYVLQSNIQGKISFFNVWNENQTVNKSDLVFTIIPIKNVDYIAKLKVPLTNSGKIKIGQNVNIKLSGYPDSEYGVIKGKVVKISLTPNEEGLYLLDVTLSDKLITTYGKRIEFKQEMQGSAEVITEDLRLIERVFYQFKKIFDK